MQRLMNRSMLIGSAALLLVGAACSDLDVKNPNNPDILRALASGEDVKSIAISTVNSWYLSATYVYPALAMNVAADASAANFGNFGMRFHNLEPRAPYINSTSAGDDKFVTQAAWEDHYGTLGAANDVLKAIKAGVKIEVFDADASGNRVTVDETMKYKHLAMFSQAASMMHLALQFDSAFVVDEDFDPQAAASLTKYDGVSAAAMTRWDALIASLQGKSDEYDPSVLPLVGAELTSQTLLQISNTMAALTLRLTPRTRTELDAKPASFWSQILTYADNGISGAGDPRLDMTVQGDFNNWYSYVNYYGNENTWMRVDHRVINRMDSFGPNAPVGFRYTGTSDIKPPQNPLTNDQRLGDGSAGHDFRFRNNVIGDPARGLFMQSAYSHDRYIDHSRFTPTAARTAVPFILAAENDLLIAEALVRTGGDRARAASLINTTRVGRGQLTPMTVANTDAELLAAIDYERDIELFNTNDFAFYYARSAPVDSPLGAHSAGGGRLQDGTQLHYPLPARELETLKKQLYTYGGVGQPVMMVVGNGGSAIRLSRPSRPPSPAEMLFAGKF